MPAIRETHTYEFYITSVFVFGSPTAGVTRWWVGRDNAILSESTSSRSKCLKTRRLPPSWPRRTLSGVGCTLCWAHFLW